LSCQRPTNRLPRRQSTTRGARVVPPQYFLAGASACVHGARLLLLAGTADAVGGVPLGATGLPRWALVLGWVLVGLEGAVGADRPVGSDLWPSPSPGVGFD